jgi:hypothetical protein
MRRTVTAWLAMLACCAAGYAAATSAETREWRFDVSLDGRPIGEHRYLLREAAGTRELVSEANFRVRILFFDAYRYAHRAEERWRGDCLQRLQARTDANGKQTVVDVEPTDACVQTFAYWNASILQARTLLNPQTGEYVPVEVRKLGPETLAGQAAERFRLIGSGREPLEIDLWYSPARDWLALESRTPEGRRLRYARK